MILPTSHAHFSRGRPAGSAAADGSTWVAALPAVGACLFAAWCGSFYSGAAAGAAIVGQLLVLLAGAAGLVVGGGSTERRSRWDPLVLGPGGPFLLGALLLLVALAWWLSPVPRAGRVGVVLLPAFLALPAAVAAAWGTQRARRLGVRWVAAGVAGVGLWALGRWIATRGALPAEPLGQHILFATWVVALVPLTAAGLRPSPGKEEESGSGRAPGWRALCGAATILGVAMVLATRSFSGALALAVEAFVLLAVLPEVIRTAPRVRKALRATAGVTTLAVVALGVIAARGGDPSIAARVVYWKAGWQGLLDRPLVGYGPGSTAWTLAGALRPVPGVSPPQEVVGEVHLLPLAIAYEVGLPALAVALAVVGLFGWRRVRQLATGDDPVLAAAGLAGLAGVAVMGLATADWRVTALPVAAAVAAGAALAGAGRAGPAGPSAPERDAGVPGPCPGPRLGGWPQGGVVVLYLLATVVVLVPVDRAHWLYDRAFDRSVELARDAGDAPARTPAGMLQRAAELDPAFPLYRFHAARQNWLSSRGRREHEEVAREALRAAELGRGVAALWLRGGAAAAAVGSREVAAPSFELACALDPLGAMAPFSLLAVGSPLHRPEALGARALAAEPRLGAATLWEERPDLLDQALEELTSVSGIDAGWREEVVRRIRALPRGEDAGRVATIALVVDGLPSASLSLHAFRRLPWRVELVPVPVRASGVERLADLPPATVLPGTDPRLFPATCTGPFAPQMLRKTLWKTW